MSLVSGIKTSFSELFNLNDKSIEAEEAVDYLLHFLETHIDMEAPVDEKKLNMIIKITTDYKDEKQICLLASHIISNLALNEQNVSYMNEHMVCNIMIQMLQMYIANSRLVWKVTSAIWNLSRPNLNANMYTNAPCIVLRALKLNMHSNKASHTCLGALSNLALVQTDVFILTFDESMFKIILEAATKHRKYVDVSCHFGSLVANLAAQQELALICVETEFIPLLVRNLYSFPEEYELVKHTLAALHNLSDVSGFLLPFLLCNGVEIVMDLKNCFENCEEIQTFVPGLFEMAGIYPSCTTSIHAACINFPAEIVVNLLATYSRGLEVKDLDGYTPLEISILEGCELSIQLLASLGANTESAKKLAYKMEDEIEASLMTMYVQEGKEVFLNAINSLEKYITDFTHDVLIDDVSQIICKFLGGFDILMTNGIIQSFVSPLKVDDEFELEN